jgi:flagellar protein FliS|tara:strand:+ start:51740 stop:52126 length:387 start_codon:yes stop_codon:yes gene_type:complete
MIQTSRRNAAQYANNGIETAVVGASPAQLVKLMFDELRSTLGTLQHCTTPERREMRSRLTSRAVSILYALLSSLDMEQGGKIAEDLSAIYDYCIRKLQSSVTAGDSNALTEVNAIIDEIASAWTEIMP